MINNDLSGIFWVTLTFLHTIFLWFSNRQHWNFNEFVNIMIILNMKTYYDGFVALKLSKWLLLIPVGMNKSGINNKNMHHNEITKSRKYL